MQEQKAKLQKKMKKLKMELKEIGPVMRGSIVELKMRCGNKKCKCNKDKKYKHPAKYFSVNINKKTKLIYLGDKRVDLAKKYNDNYLKLWDIINQMTEINMELFKFR